MADKTEEQRSKKAGEQAYDHKAIEKRWQAEWERMEAYRVDTSRPVKEKYYCLDMLPYPSGAGMHVGHVEGYTATDVISRYMRMNGFSVIHPMGWDSFGLPAENYALKVDKHPTKLIDELVANFKSQLCNLGFSYDWTKEINTCDSGYIKWTQWFFLLMYKRGLAYRAEAPTNWCDNCKTVLANEQVVDGKCERCGSEVEKRMMRQWFFKITEYADRLLEDLEGLDWPESTKMGQRNWIGKKKGINIEYEVEGSEEKIVCFTTRPDTNFGATFIVLGPEHPLLRDSKFISQMAEINAKQVEDYIEKTKNKSELERISEGREKSGVFTGRYAINNLTGEKMPIWVSDFVLGHVGTGAVVGVPGHDMRDFEFAKKFGLPIKRVVVGSDNDDSEITSADQVQEEEGKMINSKFLNGMDIHAATQKIMDYLEEKGWGKRVVSYKLRDWLISRQRYWGAPIPIVYCGKCGEVPLSIEDLPLELPYIEDFKPKGKAPLATDSEFVNTKCPKCGGRAKRETDTMDGFVDNSWYYYRYLDPNNQDAFCGEVQLKHWMPVDIYVGGAEHTVGHLNYSRFFTKVLFDEGLIDFREPFLKLRHPGIVLGEDSRKMSKRWGNVINPNDVVEKYGADSVRLYELFMGPFDESIPWSNKGLVGCRRFLMKVWGLYSNLQFSPERREGKIQESTNRVSWKLQQTIKKVEEDIEELKFNTAIAAMMELVNMWREEGEQLSVEDARKFLLILAPFAPHMAEELWQRLNNEIPISSETSSTDAKAMADRQRFRSHRDGTADLNSLSAASNDWSVHQQEWPEYDESLLVEEEVEIPVQINGKLRARIRIQNSESRIQERVEELALADERVKKWTEGKEIKKVIFVPGKLLNLVVG